MVPSLTANRVFETSLSVGPGPYVLIGAVPGGYVTFAQAISNGLQQPFFCTAVEPQTGLWKTGFATLTGNTLTFTQISDNNSGTTANIAFTGTLVNIFVTVPSNSEVYLDQSGNINAAMFPIQATLAGLQALTGYPAGTLGAVTNDTANAAANNGIYSYTGSAWTLTPAASQAYVNNAVANGRVAPLAEVDCASTASLTLSGEQIINGFQTSASRVAAMGNGATAGVYVSGSGAWTRSTDANTAAKIGLASFLVGPNDQVNGGKTFQCQQLAANITLGTTPLTFAVINDPTFLQSQITALQNFAPLRYLFHPTSSTTVYPYIIGASAILLGWDIENQFAVGLGIDSIVKAQLAPFNQLLRGMYFFNGSDQTKWIPWMDPTGAAFVPSDLSGGGGGGRVTPPVPLPTGDIPTIDTFYQLPGSSQSLETGEHAQPVAPTQPTYGHQTFGSGPRSSKPGSVGNNASPGTTTLVALFENTLSANAVSSNGETACSGWANGFTQFAAQQNGVTPGTQLFVCSAAGLNGATIEAISPGGSGNWWQLFVDQSTEALARIKALSMSNTISVPACDFPQGASDLTDTVAQIKTLFIAYQAAVQAQVLANTGQTYPVKLLLTVLSSDITGTTGAMQQAQFELCRDQPRLFTFVTSGQTLQYYTGDYRHYSTIGQLIRGNYLARATKQIMLDHIYPPWLQPISATVNSNGFFSLKFIVPVFPVILNGRTFQSGIRIIDQTGDLPLTDLGTEDDTVTAVFSRPVNGAWTVQIGLDYLDPTGPPISLGATNDIYDSCADSFISDGVTYTMPHVCPPCILTGITLGSQ